MPLNKETKPILLFFIFAYFSIYVSTEDYYVIFGNMSNKGILHIKDSDIHFNTGIDGTVARDDRGEEVGIKCSPHNFRLDTLDDFG